MANSLDQLRARYQAQTYEDQDAVIARLLKTDQRRVDEIAAAQQQATALIEACRANKDERSLLDAFLGQFGLSSEEGVALMCLAESVVRIPDQDTVDELVAEKIGDGDRWRKHLGESESLLVNASTWALMLTGEVVELGRPVRSNFGGWLGQLVNRMGEPVIRQSLRYAMRLLGNEFVFATSATQAMEKAEPEGLYSFDMLGEAARTMADANAYELAYRDALRALHPAQPVTDCLSYSGISVKLSALHPRYETTQREVVLRDLYPRLLGLAEMAAADNLQLTIDAEEANRLDLSVDLLQRLMAEPQLQHWQGLGLALQAYGRRAAGLVDYLAALARHHRRRLIVRLVKGAYWDAEIKHAQQLGLTSYPVFTQKPATDLSFIVCAQKLLAAPDAFYPQFATHNAYTLANILQMGRVDGAKNVERDGPAPATGWRPFELQRLHGMGDLLYHTAAQLVPDLPPVRTYAPVGPHQHLMAYLIRRLLENGANSSFVNRFLDDRVPVAQLVRSARTLVTQPQTTIADPPQLYGPQRLNAQGLELNDPVDVARVETGIAEFAQHRWGDGSRQVVNPANLKDVVGAVSDADASHIQQAFAEAAAAQPAWDGAGGASRATVLRDLAQLLELHRYELMALLIREAGKTWSDALDEVREAVDFCRYYANQCEQYFAHAVELPGPTGEQNRLCWHGRGVFVCIAPWNFPLAIFTGQVVAALAAGNSVLAKPAEQTPLIAQRVATLLYQAGLPADVFHLIQGDGSVGQQLVEADEVAGVAFTGSTAVARHINRTLAAKDGPIVPLIAETGGQNAMIVDSTAMLEQVTDDVLRSAFGSGGQRCSALRVLCVQSDIADDLLTMIEGAMQTLKVGDPWQRSSDIGPLIDAQALAALTAYCDQPSTRLRCQTPLSVDTDGYYFAPRLLLLDSIRELGEEQFGPILHVVRYHRSELDSVLDDLLNSGYGLTLGIHSRNPAFVERVYQRSRAGNVYVNRNMIGAVVGVQPFGGTGISGTGPKAGGPHYLTRFATERALADNTAAIGGNLELLTDTRPPD